MFVRRRDGNEVLTYRNIRWQIPKALDGKIVMRWNLWNAWHGETSSDGQKYKCMCKWKIDVKDKLSKYKNMW